MTQGWVHSCGATVYTDVPITCRKCGGRIKPMTHRKDECEEWAIARLQDIINLDLADRDALPGSVVKLVKQAQVIMKKRRRDA